MIRWSLIILYHYLPSWIRQKAWGCLFQNKTKAHRLASHVCSVMILLIDSWYSKSSALKPRPGAASPGGQKRPHWGGRAAAEVGRLRGERGRIRPGPPERLRWLSPVQCESTTHPMIPRFYATLVRGRTWPRGGGQTAAAVGRLRRGEDQGRPGPQLRSSLSFDPLSRWWQRGLINSKSQRTCAGRVWFYMILWYFMNGQCGRQNCWILFFLFSCSILMAQERLWFVVRVWWIIVETC